MGQRLPKLVLNWKFSSNCCNDGEDSIKEEDGNNMVRSIKPRRIHRHRKVKKSKQLHEKRHHPMVEKSIIL